MLPEEKQLDANIKLLTRVVFALGHGKVSREVQKIKGEQDFLAGFLGKVDVQQL